MLNLTVQRTLLGPTKHLIVGQSQVTFTIKESDFGSLSANPQREHLFNPLTPNINMHIICTVLHIFPMILIRRICLTIKTFLHLVIIFFTLMTFMHLALLANSSLSVFFRRRLIVFPNPVFSRASLVIGRRSKIITTSRMAAISKTFPSYLN